MPFRTSYLFALIPSALALICLAGCPTPRRGPEAPAAGVPATLPEGPRAPGREGRPYDVVPNESLLTILAFRGGTLAKVGHNHVIASHDLTGTFYVPEDVLRSSFELHVPVAQLTIDEPGLRAKEGADFPAEVPDSAKEGTRRNMLGEALLNGAQYPELTLTSQRILPGAMGTSVNADVLITVRGQTHTVSVPVVYELKGGELRASGELAIRQTELGLTPFSAMLGALQVQDELRVKFNILARAAPVKGS